MGGGGSGAKQRPEPVDPGRARRIELRFDEPDGAKRDPRTNLSAVAADGATLFVANDEEAGVRSFVWNPRKGRFQERDYTRLADIFRLPEDDGEMDIEGLEVAGTSLWIVGSHSLGRRMGKKSDSDARTIRQLAKLRQSANRHFLGRVAIAREGGGRSRLGGKGACLDMGERGGRLLSLLAADRHLAPYLGIPAKENGFDIEGIAALGETRDRLFLGLRGPVLRGWAILIELRLAEPTPGRLDLLELDGRRRYRKHFLDLGGLGVRELLADPKAPDDLLILAGPTMSLDGPVHMFRWRDAARHDAAQLVTSGELSAPMLIPWGRGCDHAEGVCLLPKAAGGSGREALVLHDSPDKEKRLRAPWKMMADLLPLAV